MVNEAYRFWVTIFFRDDAPHPGPGLNASIEVQAHYYARRWGVDAALLANCGVFEEPEHRLPDLPPVRSALAIAEAVGLPFADLYRFYGDQLAIAPNA